MVEAPVVPVQVKWPEVESSVVVLVVAHAPVPLAIVTLVAPESAAVGTVG